MRRINQLIIVAVTSLLSIAAQAEEAKYVFYFIGDGMGMGHVNATETYRRDVLHTSDPLLMLTFPVASQVRTYSHNHPITDSAASGTALSTGYKTDNGMVGMAPDSTNLYSIARTFSLAGRGVGIASSVAGDDATPATFYSHVPSRTQKSKIALQTAESGFEFLAAPKWIGAKDKNGKSTGWTRLMEKAGYTIYRGYNEIEADKTPRAKRLLLSANPQGNQVGYTIDSIPNALTLPQITTACLKQLESTSPNGFFMMIEGGNIDWAAHAKDGGAVIKEILNFQEAIDVAYQFYLAHPEETLIVITADHDTGGLALGREDHVNGVNLSLFDYQKISKDRFSEWCKARLADKKKITWPEMKDFLSQNFGMFGAIKLDKADEQRLHKAFEETFVKQNSKDEKSLYANHNAFAATVLDVLNKLAGIGWTTRYHTGNFVPLYAIGSGANLFCRNLNNTEIAPTILKAAGIKPALK